MRALKLIALWLGLILIGSIDTARAQGAQDFVLVNATGYSISHVFISPINDDDWGDDILGKDIMEDGEDVPIVFARKERSCKWDLQITFDDDDEKVVWRGFDLCKISRITLKYNRKTGATTAFSE